MYVDRVENSITIVVVSVIFAFLLTIIPIPHAFIWFRPSFVLLVVFYWLLAFNHFGIFSSWFVGLLLDIITGITLGFNALFFSLLAYVLLKCQTSIKSFSSSYNIFLLFIVELIYLLFQHIINIYLHIHCSFWINLLPLFTTLLLWPVVVFLLSFRRKQHQVI